MHLRRTTEPGDRVIDAGVREFLDKNDDKLRLLRNMFWEMLAPNPEERISAQQALIWYEGLLRGMTTRH